MKQSPTWEANRSSAGQVVTRILRYLKVHYRVHKGPPPATNLRQISSVKAPPIKLL
jgi:hypothetical protein